jgi:septal ring factor EnvC (AmiA/AmiB activator)
LNQFRNSVTLESVASGVSPPHPRSIAPVVAQIPGKEDYRMTLKSTWAGFAVAVALSLSMTACKDTKTLQENDQLKAKVAELQKENGQIGNDLETVTADRDALKKENEALKAQIKPRKAKKKASSRKRRKSQAARMFQPQPLIWNARTRFLV